MVSSGPVKLYEKFGEEDVTLKDRLFQYKQIESCFVRFVIPSRTCSVRFSGTSDDFVLYFSSTMSRLI